MNHITAPKALVIYQPAKSKVSEQVAGKLAEGLQKAGYEVTIAHPSAKIEKELPEYELISFGSPVFFGKISAAVEKLIRQMKSLPDTTVLFYSVGGSPETPELEYVRKLFAEPGPAVMTKFLVSDPGAEEKAFELGFQTGTESRNRNEA